MADLQAQQVDIDRYLENLMGVVRGIQERSNIGEEQDPCADILQELALAQGKDHAERTDILARVSDKINDIQSAPELQEALGVAFESTVEKIYLRAPADTWLSQVGNYQLSDDIVSLSKKTDIVDEHAQPHQAIQAILPTQESRNLLYQGAFPDGAEDTTQRTAFLQFLEEKYQNYPQENAKPRPTVKMEEFLGKEGLALYKSAVAEEARSRHFRDAVFLKSTQHFEGDKWNKKMVLWVGGPSASGKTYGASGAVHTMSQHMPRDELDDSGNLVVSVDGGIEREVSQMRQMVLQVALAKGYKGISDLHSNTKLGTKELVRKAALQEDDLSLVIPETFAESAFKLSDRYKKSEMLQYNNDPRVVQAFSEVRAEEGFQDRFKTSVKHMGTSRAWFKEENEFSDDMIKMNNRDIGCESKIYDGKGFIFGKYASKEARNNLKEINPEGLYIRVTNDLVFVKRDIKGHWQECGADDVAEFKLAARDFDKWKKLIADDRDAPDLKEWWSLQRDTDGLAKPQVEVTPNDTVRISVKSAARPEIDYITISKRDYDRYLEAGGNKGSIKTLEQWCDSEHRAGRLITPLGAIFHNRPGDDPQHRHSAPTILEQQPSQDPSALKAPVSDAPRQHASDRPQVTGRPTVLFSGGPDHQQTALDTRKGSEKKQAPEVDRTDRDIKKPR